MVKVSDAEDKRMIKQLLGEKEEQEQGQGEGQESWLRFTRQCLCFLALLSLFYSQFAFVVFAQEQDSQNTTMLAQEALIDLNSADAQTLAAALSGVGLVKAQEIIRYRETYGDFVAVEELAEVEGIGQTLLERNRHRLQPLRKVSKNE